MVTDFAFDGFRFALLAERFPQIAHERSWAFAGSAIASAVSKLPQPAIEVGYRLFYWTQMAVVLSFLVILPLGEHFHIVTALPTLYFRRGRPANRVPPVDLDKLMEAEDESQMRAGVRGARDLTWKEGLDAFTCTECGRCKDACPTHLTGKPLSLKMVFDSVKHHLVAHGDLIVSGDPEAKLPALVGPVIADETLWACTTCGYCEAACPIELEHLDKFFRMDGIPRLISFSSGPEVGRAGAIETAQRAVSLSLKWNAGGICFDQQLGRHPTIQRSGPWASSGRSSLGSSPV